MKECKNKLFISRKAKTNNNNTNIKKKTAAKPMYDRPFILAFTNKLTKLNRIYYIVK